MNFFAELWMKKMIQNIDVSHGAIKPKNTILEYMSFISDSIGGNESLQIMNYEKG